MQVCLHQQPALRMSAESMHAALLSESLDGSRGEAAHPPPAQPPVQPLHVVVDVPPRAASSRRPREARAVRREGARERAPKGLWKTGLACGCTVGVATVLVGFMLIFTSMY